MVHAIKLMIRKSKKGKVFYRVAIPVPREELAKAGLKEDDDFLVVSSGSSITITRKKTN